MELIKLTSELCFEIIKKNHNKYFKAKELAEEILVQEYEIPFVVIKYNNELSLTKMKYQISRKLSPILSDLRKSGKIEKYNNKFWKIKS